jgi:hypothetical protein
VRITDALRGEPLPCKVSLRGVGGTRTPALGMDEQHGRWLDRERRVLGVGPWLLLAEGRADVALPPGRYHLTATRGGEYEALDLGEIDLGPRRGALVTGDLRRTVDTEGEVCAEFHVHSEPSFDCDVPLDQRVLSLAVEGVEVFASTDHDASGDFLPALRATGLGRHLRWLRGDEITAEGLGHFNVYPLPADIDPATRLRPEFTSVSELVARARAVAPDAVLQLNHPLWRQHAIGYWALAGLDPMTGRARLDLVNSFDTVEVWNGHTLDEWADVSVGVEGVLDAWMSTLQLGRGATATGSSDTHRVSTSPPGWPRTYVRVPDDDPSRVTDVMVTTALRAGDASLTSGPFLRATVAGGRPGSLVRAVEGRVTVDVDVQGVSWTPADRVEVVANRAVVAARELPRAPRGAAPERQTFSLTVTLQRDAWVVVRTRAREPVGPYAGAHQRPMASLALVNPVYIDVDGDGRWTPPGAAGP